MKQGDIINDRWKVIKSIASGGQGEVFKVIDINTNKLGALKFLKNQKDLERRTRMFREITNVQKLDDGHLMKILDSNKSGYKDVDSKLFYVSEFIDGITLETYVEENSITFDLANNFFLNFLDVIKKCHDKSIIHRDIKPDNILLRDGMIDNFVVIDFGLSFNFEDGEEDLTRTNQQLGNRFMILPELVNGHGEEKRCYESDLTQAAAVFLYVLTGIIPNSIIDGEGLAPHRRKQAEVKICEKITNDTIFSNLMLFFDKAFSTQIACRYHTADEMIEAINELDVCKVNERGQIMTVEKSTVLTTTSMQLKYDQLMRILNPTTGLINPSGLNLPVITNVTELVPYAVAMPDQVKRKVAKYYEIGDFATAASQVWIRSINLLRKRILSLGEEFVADMVDTEDLEYVRELPPHRTINLAYDLGFIDKAGRKKLFDCNTYYNFFNNDEADEYEEMPQDEANIIIKYCIKYVLYNNDESFGLQFNDFREKLKSCKITDLYDDANSMFETCPYFYLKTTVRSLLNLFGETEGIEYENVTMNMNLMFPEIWGRLKLEERRALADAYTDCVNRNDSEREGVLNKILIKVHGFDYVKENIRSRTYILTARKLVDAHFDVNNYYTEPNIIKKLEDLGTKIPNLALKESMTAILYVKLGNSYGVSWEAEKIADRMLDAITKEEWIIYLERYFLEESDLLDSIERTNKVRSQWKQVIKRYELNKLGLVAPQVKKYVNIV